MMNNDNKPNNLKLWDSVSITDVKQTKAAKVDGNQLTALNTTYMIMKATQAFGVVGEGWGYEIVSERLDDAGPIFKDKDQTILLCEAKLHTIIVKVWYMKDGKRSETIPHYGHTKYIYKSSWGFTVDYEYAKKSLSDALKKCLSMLGFCADVYMGKFDDPQYRELSQHQVAMETADNKAEMVIEKKQELLKYIDTAIKSYERLPSIAPLSLVYQKDVNFINSLCLSIAIDPKKSIETIKAACDLRMTTIKESKK